MATLKNTTINDTGYITVPSGTIAQRPAAPTAGMYRYNTDLSCAEYYNGTYWIDPKTGTPPLVTSGLALYLDATNPTSYPSSGGRVWYDISGNGKNFTWSASPSFSSTGKISYFDTLGLTCSGPASNSFGINNTSGYTIFLAMSQNALKNCQAFQFYSTTAGFNRGIFSHCTWSDDNIYFDQGGCCNSDTRTFVGTGGSQTWNIFTLRRLTNSSTRTISKNGTTLTTNTAAAANIDLNSDAVLLADTIWDTKLGAFLAYSRGLSDDEITQTYTALRGKFGI